MILRLFLFAALMLLSVFAPVWILAACALAYALRFTAYELLVLAACIDAYYGGSSALPYYTLVTAALLLAVEYIKSRLIVYNETK